MKERLFVGKTDHPQHVSVGALVVNEEGKICCHKFSKEYLRENSQLFKDIKTNMYLLMRETLKNGEILEDAVIRGCEEEFGMDVEILDYLGSIQGYFSVRDVEIQKTTIYFICRMNSQDDSKREDGMEGESELLWLTPQELLDRYVDQKDLGYVVDESEIISRYIKLTS